MIDKFLERTLGYNARMVEAVSECGFMLVDVQWDSVTEVTERCLLALGIDEKKVSAHWLWGFWSKGKTRRILRRKY